MRARVTNVALSLVALALLLWGYLAIAGIVIPLAVVLVALAAAFTAVCLLLGWRGSRRNRAANAPTRERPRGSSLSEDILGFE